MLRSGPDARARAFWPAVQQLHRVSRMQKRFPAIVVLGVMIACGKVDHTPVVDAARADATGTMTCNPVGIFGAPTPLVGFATTAGEAIARLSPDELTMFFSGTVNSTDWNLYVATRSHRSEPFNAPTPLGVNSPSNEYDPVASRDGSLLLFHTDRDGIGRIYAASRSTSVGNFINPSPILGVASMATSENDAQAFLTSDDQELWFTSDRAGGAGGFDIYRATRSGIAFSSPVRVSELSSSSHDYLPVLGEDRLTIYWSSTRPGGQGGFDIWRSHRSTTADGWGTPVLVPELNSSATDLAAWLSPDSCRLYMASERAGNGFDILVAERLPSD